MLGARMKLGTLLLRNAAIGLSQLEGALRNQVLYGGRLGTNLVELGFIDLELLSSYLAELTGFPIATPTLLEDADRGLLDRLGADDAHRLRAVPIGQIRQGEIAVAFVEPTDAAAIEHVANRLGSAISPYVVPELRALYYLERHFGLPRGARFVRSAHPDAPVVPAAPDATPPDRRRSQPAHGLVMPPAVKLEPRRRRASPAAFGAAVPISLAFDAACSRIEAATHRDQIASVVVEYARGRCDALVVFLIRDGNALGWRAYLSPPSLAPALDDLSLPLGGASSLQSAHDAGQAFVGPPPPTARPVETRLWAVLGTFPDPANLAVVPVLVKQRPVNLIYAHTLSGPPLQRLAAELGELAARAQTAYLRMIRQARGS